VLKPEPLALPDDVLTSGPGSQPGLHAVASLARLLRDPSRPETGETESYFVRNTVPGMVRDHFRRVTLR
jgi:hypothetical protein